MPFKIGDKVRFKSDQGWRLIENPGVYVVVGVDEFNEDDQDQLISFRKGNKNSSFFNHKRFELVVPRKIEDDPEYKELFI